MIRPNRSKELIRNFRHMGFLSVIIATAKRHLPRKNHYPYCPCSKLRVLQSMTLYFELFNFHLIDIAKKNKNHSLLSVGLRIGIK